MDMSWAVDVFCLFMVFAGAYMGFKRGLLLGLYNLIAGFIITIIAVHNYIGMTELIRKKVPAMPALYGDFLSFSILLVSGILIAFLLSGVLSFFISSEEMGRAEKAFGAILGFLSGILITSLWMMALYLSPWRDVESAVSTGSFSRRLVFLPGYIYSIAVDYVIRPIDKRFPANMAVYNPTKEDDGKGAGNKVEKEDKDESMDALNETKETTDAAE